MKKRNKKNKVLKFVQTDSHSKVFRQDHPMSDQLREKIVGELTNDFIKYAIEQNYMSYCPPLVEYVVDHHTKKEKQEILLNNLFWWRLLYEAHVRHDEGCVGAYIAENNYSLRKRPILLSWLREWKKAVPKFYYVGYKYNDRVFVVVDILEEKMLDVVVYAPHPISPKTGNIIMGTLIPIGDGLYFPVVDFYHFEFEAREAIAKNLLHHYNKHLTTSTMYEAFIHVLSVVLQIENKITMNNTAETPSN